MSRAPRFYKPCPQVAMSEMGQKATIWEGQRMSGLPPKAEVRRMKRHIRFEQQPGRGLVGTQPGHDENRRRAVVSRRSAGRN
jgi:hypothetical protein